MSKKDLIDAVAEATELTKDKAGVAVDAVINHIEKTMKKGEEVRLPGFGTFKVAKRKARKARNPQTGVEMMLKAVAGAEVPGFEESEGHAELKRLLFRLFRARPHCSESAPFLFGIALGSWHQALRSALDDCLLPTAYCLGSTSPARAVSSVVERFVYTEDVGSSTLSPPTIPFGLRPAARRMLDGLCGVT